jgi:hypothetical protein
MWVDGVVERISARRARPPCAGAGTYRRGPNANADARGDLEVGFWGGVRLSVEEGVLVVECMYFCDTRV